MRRPSSTTAKTPPLREALDGAEAFLRKARALGEGELFINRRTSTSIEVRDGEVEALEVEELLGAGLRLLSQGRMGFAFTGDLSPGGFEELLRGALDNARAAEPDEANSLPEPRASYQGEDRFDPEVLERELSEKVELARLLERAARDEDPRIKKVRSADYQEAFRETVILNSRGLGVELKGTILQAALMLTAEEGGEHETGWDLELSRTSAGIDVRRVARRAARMALSLLGARPLKTRKAPILLSPRVAGELLGILSDSLSADSVLKGKSLLAGKVGERVAAPGLTLIDDGLLPEGPFSGRADGEGVPMQRTPLIEKGVLLGFLESTYTARRRGCASTGNAVRRTHEIPPKVDITNLFIPPGGATEEELMREADRGLYVLDIMGAHTGDPISGDFSLGASGFWFEGGERAYPVRGVTISGNLLEVLRAIEGVGDNLRFFGPSGSPALLLGPLTIGGR